MNDENENKNQAPAEEAPASEPVTPGVAPAEEPAPTPAEEPAPTPAAEPAPPTPAFEAPKEAFSPNPPPKPPKKSGKKTGWVILGALYLLLLVGFVGMFARAGMTAEPPATETQEETKETAPSNPPIVTNPSTDGNKPIVGEGYTGNSVSAVELYANNVESVVFVQSNYSNGYSTGSGFVIDSQNGYILTNCHVVEGSKDIVVSFSNKKSYPATLIGADEINDVAVLQIKAEGLKHVTIGNSDNIRVGEDLFVIGNPLGDVLSFSLTKGIISGTNRVINTGEYNISTFQTDAAINSGNSGGPAFDATGAVVGIASAKYSKTGVEGICFCIPINDAMEIAKDLVDYGYVKGRPNFGVTVSTSPGYKYTVDQYGRRVRVETAYGALIEEIGKESCAAKAGLKVGDIVTKLNQTKITTASELINVKNSYKAGDSVTLEVWRDGETLTFTVTLDEYTP